MRQVVLAIAAVLALPQPGRAAVLVADWTFSNAGNLGLDSSGKGNNANVVNSVSQAVGPGGSRTSLLLGPSSQFQKIGGLAGLTGATGVSYSAWVYVSGANGSYNGVISQDSGGCCVQRLLLAGGSQPFVNADRHTDQTLSDTLALRTWNNIVLTETITGANSLTARVYVNGSLLPDGTLNEGWGMNSLAGINTYLGAGEGGTPYRLSGNLADVRVYEGALSASEVSGLYLAGAGGTYLTNSTDAPEPATLALLASGLAALRLLPRRRRRT